MSKLLDYHNGILYGPVNSRRLGRSLGINLLPPGKKTCNFNCLYCQYGWTEESPEKASGFPTVTEVIDALKGWKADGHSAPNSLTFSGNGEPTLYPQFKNIVDEVIKFRDEEYPDTVVSILSNSTRIVYPEIREAVSKIDNAILKLDSASDGMIKSYSGPNFNMDVNKTVHGMSKLDNVILQSLFATGPKGNLIEDHINVWLEKVEEINPRWVMLYTLYRAFPSDSIQPATQAELESIKDRLTKRGIKARVF